MEWNVTQLELSNRHTEITGNNNNRATGIAYLIQNPCLSKHLVPRFQKSQIFCNQRPDLLTVGKTTM